jgi:hypothetical protein
VEWARGESEKLEIIFTLYLTELEEWDNMKVIKKITYKILGQMD